MKPNQESPGLRGTTKPVPDPLNLKRACLSTWTTQYCMTMNLANLHQFGPVHSKFCRLSPHIQWSYVIWFRKNNCRVPKQVLEFPWILFGQSIKDTRSRPRGHSRKYFGSKRAYQQSKIFGTIPCQRRRGSTFWPMGKFIRGSAIPCEGMVTNPP